MRFSLFLPSIHEGRFIPLGGLTPAHVFELSQAAEALGYDGVWIGEFMESQDDVKRQYEAPPSYYAPIATLGALAARTERVRLTTGVLVLPYHDPLVLAREFATLDVLSGGRVRLGVGLGGSFENYRRTRRLAGRRVRRADLMEEALRAMRVLWSERRASFEGEYFAFRDVETYPKPVQDPLPILIAGGVRDVVERVGRLAEGWIDTYSPPERIRERVAELEAAASAAGRTGPFEIARGFFCAIADTDEAARRVRAESTPGGEPTGPPNSPEREFLLIGSPDRVRAQLERYRATGVTEIDVAFYHRDLGDALAQAERFAREVMPAFDD